MNGGAFLFWYWRYHSLNVDGYETLRDAVAASEAMEESGSGSTDHFEAVGAGVVPTEVVARARDELFAEYEADAATREPPRRCVTVIEVSSLKSPKQWAPVGWLFEGDDVNDALREARKRFGPDRVRQRAPRVTP